MARIYKAGGIGSYLISPSRIQPLFENIPPPPSEAEPPAGHMWTDEEGIWGYRVIDDRKEQVKIVNNDGTIDGSVLPENKNAVLETYYKKTYGDIAGEVLFNAHYAHEKMHLKQRVEEPERFLRDNPEYWKEHELEAYEAGIKMKRDAIRRLGCR